MTDASLEEIQSVLERERLALRAGDSTALKQIAAEKGKIFAEVSIDRLDVPKLKRLLVYMRRNEKLLEAYRDGLKAAQARLAAVHAVKTELSHYTQTGERGKTAGIKSQLERRA